MARTLPDLHLSLTSRLQLQNLSTSGWLDLTRLASHQLCIIHLTGAPSLSSSSFSLVFPFISFLSTFFMFICCQYNILFFSHCQFEFKKFIAIKKENFYLIEIFLNSIIYPLRYTMFLLALANPQTSSLLS